MSAPHVTRTMELIRENPEDLDVFLFWIELDCARWGIEPDQNMSTLWASLTPTQHANVTAAIIDAPDYLAAFEAHVGPWQEALL